MWRQWIVAKRTFLVHRAQQLYMASGSPTALKTFPAELGAAGKLPEIHVIINADGSGGDVWTASVCLYARYLKNRCSYDHQTWHTNVLRGYDESCKSIYFGVTKSAGVQFGDRSCIRLNEAACTLRPFTAMLVFSCRLFWTRSLSSSCLSVRLSVTSRCYTKTAKPRITQNPASKPVERRKHPNAF